MTALGGGGWRRDSGRSRINSLLERMDSARNGGRVPPRSLDVILPERGDETRSRDMEATWLAFVVERDDDVTRALRLGRSPPEIAYAIGELIHTYFRTRGVILTSAELRRLVAELLQVHAPPSPQPAARAGAPPAAAPAAGMAAKTDAPASPTAAPGKPSPDTAAPEKAAAAPQPAGSAARPSIGDSAARATAPADEATSLVSFAAEPSKRGSVWTGGEAAPAGTAVPDSAFAVPPSRLVDVVGRDAASLDRLLARTLEVTGPRLGPTQGRVGREEALRAIDAAVDEVLRAESQTLSPELRERLVVSALSEICGLGLIDRLWADASVRAVYINGPKSVYVERDGNLEPSPAVFRDQAHLVSLVSRLVEAPVGGVADVTLRDGGSGTVIFPPAAPNGPVLAIRRSEPGNATFARLIAAEILDRPIASLLRLAARSRLKVLVVGPPGSGKSTLLAAIARDLGAAARVVTIARHRDFRWPAPAKVELLATDAASYAALLAAGQRLRPELLVLDSVQRHDTHALTEHFAAGHRGTIVASEPATVTPALARAVDLVVRLGRGRDGLFRTVALEDAAGVAVFAYENGQFQRRGGEPAFAEAVRAAGHGAAFANLLR